MNGVSLSVIFQTFLAYLLGLPLVTFILLSIHISLLQMRDDRIRKRRKRMSKADKKTVKRMNKRLRKNGYRRQNIEIHKVRRRCRKIAVVFAFIPALLVAFITLPPALEDYRMYVGPVLALGVLVLSFGYGTLIGNKMQDVYAEDTEKLIKPYL